MRSRIGGAALLVAVAVSGCAHNAARQPATAAASVPAAVVATAAGTGPLDIFGASTTSAVATHLSPRTDYGSPRVLLVLGQSGDRLHVLLPTRPVGSQGWIRLSDVSLSRTPYHVVVSLHEHSLRLYDGAATVLATPVATGAPATPTPTGTFFVTDLVQVGKTTPWFGPFALGLSGFSPVLTSFDGGDGQIALHGTDQPQLIGRAVSHGCVRLPNAVVARLAGVLPLGTPVTITA